MTAQFIDPENVEWDSVQLIKPSPDHPEYLWEFRLPRPLSQWGVFDYWERERFTSMASELVHGMTLFDVGAEHGWCSLIYADMVGPENMVLIEPAPYFWPNIRETWQNNYHAPPRACYRGLISDKTTELHSLTDWPECSYGPLIDRNSYRYIWDNESDPVPEITLDDLVERSGIIPDAITIDVEGAEHLVLAGAEQTLARHHPLVWVSIHPDMMQTHYSASDAALHDFMAGLGYKGRHLATDHEQHWLFV